MVFKATERIYVNADYSAVVPVDSPEAAFLLVGEGGELSDEDAAKYGLTNAQATPPEATDDEAERAADEQAVTRTPTRSRTEGK